MLILARVLIFFLFLISFLLANRLQKKWSPSHVSLITYQKWFLISCTALGLIAVLFFGVDLPYFDSWNGIEIYGIDFNWKHIMWVSGGHVILLPRLLEYMIGNLTSWNTKYFLGLQWLFCVFSTVGALWFLYKANKIKISFLTVLASAFFLFPNNAYYYVDNRFTHHLMGMALFFVALYFFQCSQGWLKHVLTPITCALTLFTSSWGVACWIAFAPAAFFATQQHRLWRLSWIFIGGLAWFAYMQVFSSGYSSNHFINFHSIVLGVLDFFVMCGVFTYPYPFVIPVFGVLFLPGFFLVLSQVYVSARVVFLMGLRNWVQHPFGIGLIYCVFGGLLATVARAQFYPFDSLGMRYNHVAATFCLILVGQLSYLIAYDSLKERFYNSFRYLLTSFFIASFVVGLIYYFHRGRTHYKVVTQAVRCLKSDNPYSEYSCYSKVYPDLHLPEAQASLQERVRFLRENKISAFRE